MSKLKPGFTISDWQNFCLEVYGIPNDRDFGVMEMLSNVQRFIMRALKGIRKRDDAKTEANLLIAMSWFISLINQLHIDLDKALWERFPAVCSYCGHAPCVCRSRKIKTRQNIKIDESKKPKTLKEYQEMFQSIYPAETRSLENAGIHLAEEMGELSEAVMNYRGNHENADFSKIVLESADLFSCFLATFNSMHIDASKALKQMFQENCHVCHKLPCECSFPKIINYKV